VAKPTAPKRRRFITILGTKVKIKYVVKAMHDDEDDLLDGAFCGESMTIFVSTKSDVNATLLHEACHAALFISGASNLVTAKVEEAVVWAIENSLKDYFKF
jgi:hypothetical protein